MNPDPSSTRPLRARAAIVLAVLMAVLRFVVPVVYPDGAIAGVLGGVAVAVAIALWWLFFSRAPWTERIGVVAFAAVALIATSFAVHPSIRGGMMRMMVWFFGFQEIAFALAIAVAIARRASPASRRIMIAGAILLACGLWTMLRTDGIKGSGGAQLHWRWTPTAEERLLADAAQSPEAPAALAPAAPPPPSAPSAPEPSTSEPATPREAAKATPGEVVKAATPPTPPDVAAKASRVPVRWSGFRGANRDGVVRNVRIATDWATLPPTQVWEHPVGPGWSSFAVRGNLLYTQEQRGEDEIVACYDATTGKAVWAHRDKIRFYESNGGPGPRATPAVSGGRVFALGATGVLNALDADTGALLWTRNAVTDTGIKVPGWGISASPLVVDDLVVVAASGALAAYETRDGTKKWTTPSNGGSYSSPQLLTIDGVPQIVLLAGKGAFAVAVADGKRLWDHEWAGVPIVQPAVIGNGDLVVTTADAMGGQGIRRIAVTHSGNAWKSEERWTSNGLKPYYNDYVVHKGYAFGFDGSILSCVDLADGKRKWKGGRYGAGQLVLLPEQDLLLVISEDGELALVQATPDQFTERARIPGIEGKTWNHPVIVGDMLFVRNGEQMAAFRLPLLHD